MHYHLRTLMIVGLAGLPTFHVLAFAAKYAGAPRLLVLALAAAALCCLPLPIISSIGLVFVCPPDSDGSTT
jgi:hypothetical protein